MNAEKALITGITGQTASYLAEILLERGFEVHGIVRRASTVNTTRIVHLENSGKLKSHQTHFADLADANSIVSVLMKIQPDYIFNLGSMSHVRVSFDIPEYTAQVTGLGPLRILEALRSLGMKHVRYYNAASSEMFGISPPPQNEDTPFRPQSPYGISKLFSYWTTRCYRVGYGMFAANGILFNHESPRRGETFVTQKIVRAAARIKLGVQDKVSLGNLSAMRDWGFAGDYAEAIFLISQHKEPDDFVISTGEHHSVREFAETVFAKLGLNFEDYVDIEDKYFRPNEVPALLGDSRKARAILGWKPKITFEKLVDMMLESVMKEEEEKLYVANRA